MQKLWGESLFGAMIALLGACGVHAQDMSAEHMKHMAAQTCGAATSHEHEAGDSAFEALKARGKVGMGVDQCASAHEFDSTAYGGRVVYRMNSNRDGAGIAQIRAHMRLIASSFTNGDFTTPEFIHAGHVPGTDVMQRKRGAIVYTVRDIPRGAELRMMTKDAEAVRAVHAFMAFQRREHRAGGSM